MNVAIIQARLTSTRLPNKILLNVNNKPLLWHVVERVKKAKLIDNIVLAIPDSASNDNLELFIKQYGWHFFRGSENDVLSRYYKAAIQFEADIIVRITSDCPFVDPAIIDKTINLHIRDGNDYTAAGVEGGYPRGLDVEVMNFKTLELAYNKAMEKSEREHVTSFIYQNPKLFKFKFIEATDPVRRPDIRLTVDTEEDLLLIREIYASLNSCGNKFTTEDIINIIENNPYMQSINKHIVQKDIH